MADRFGYAIWPGVESMLACHYVLSHGSSPGTADLKALPYPLTTTYSPLGKGGFKEVGDLIITDGVEEVVLRDCRVAAILSDNSGGQSWHFRIEDRRWRWRDCGTISGQYNQLDDHAKLIPWTIRSPSELAYLCLEAMGEIQGQTLLSQTVANYKINMPPGLDSKVGKQAAQINPPWIGVIPVTGTNPPINWLNIKPAEALQQLCELFGRRLIYTWKNNGVLIDICGQGKDLPEDGSIYDFTQSMEKPVIPSKVAVFGAPTRYQGRFKLVPVGEEWDGSYRDIDTLSYVPRPSQSGGRGQITGCRVSLPEVGDGFQTTVNGIVFLNIAASTNAGTLRDAIVASIAASTHPAIAGNITVAASGVASFTLTSRVGFDFVVQTEVLYQEASAASSYTNVLLQSAQPADGTYIPGGWVGSTPGIFSNVRSTERLTRREAIDLAKKSIWKTYRLADVDCGDAGGPIKVPGFGTLVRRQQIILSDTKVEQVVPEQLDATLVLPDSNAEPMTLNFYNGYSRDAPAAVYGRHVQLGINGISGWWQGVGSDEMTPPGSQVMVPFTIDPVQQLVKFSSYVYATRRRNSGGNPQYIVTVNHPNGSFPSGVIFVLKLSEQTVASYSTSLMSGAEETTSSVVSGLIGNCNASTVFTAAAETGNETSTTFTITSLTTSTLSLTAEISGGGTQSEDAVFTVAAATVSATASSGCPINYVAPDLVLETGVNVRNALTNNPEQFFLYKNMPGAQAATPPAVSYHDDVQLNIIGIYDSPHVSNNLYGFTRLEDDAIIRAGYYLDGMIAQYHNTGSITIKYNGIRAIDVDGSIQQITWDVGETSGCETTASKNMEHNVYVAPYKTRRRAEFLDAADRQVLNRERFPDRAFLTNIGPLGI